MTAWETRGAVPSPTGDTLQLKKTRWWSGSIAPTTNKREQDAETAANESEEKLVFSKCLVLRMVLKEVGLTSSS